MQMRIAGAALALVAACSSDATDPSVEARDPVPAASGTFAGGYRVPTETPALESAARYPVEDVHWFVTGNQVTLEYKLPVGLVGGKLEVEMSGTMEPDASTVTLSSSQGDGTCVAAAHEITCHEVFTNLGALPISEAVVAQVARTEYPGAVADRVALARQFGSEPIGIVIIDTLTPIVDD